MKIQKKSNKKLTKRKTSDNNNNPPNVTNMLQKESIKKKRLLKEKRVKTFGETLKNGVSDDYMNYLKKEAKENRLIEKYL